MRCLLYVFLLFFFSSCEELPPYIDFTVPNETLVDTSYIDNNLPAPQDKMVIIEEFTGISCTWCPTGHQALYSLDSINPGRLNIVSIHAGNYAKPMPGLFDVDLRTDAGDALGTMFNGLPTAFPSAVVDRVIFSGDQDLYDSNTGSWGTRVNERLSESVPLNITVSNVSYNGQTNEISALIKLHYTESIDSAHFLSVFILEDSVLTPQLNQGTWEQDYVQKHVLRDMLTTYQGDPLNEDLVSGRVFEKEYTIAVDPNWNKDHCHILALVHHKGGILNVVQSASGHMSH
jgi:hypothetical protein